MTDSSAGPPHITKGVFFTDSQYIGLLRRWGIIGIDLIVIFLVFTAVVSGFIMVAQAEPRPSHLFLGLLCISWMYLVLFKALGIGTLGYRIFRVKIVDLEGRRPGIIRLTIRLLTTCLGIGNPLLDLVWMEMDRNRQTLRDKLTGTYVIRADAEPAGHGQIRNSRLFVLGYAFVYQHVDASGDATGVMANLRR